jgi:hypothetical protein
MKMVLGRFENNLHNYSSNLLEMAKNYLQNLFKKKRLLQ